MLLPNALYAIVNLGFHCVTDTADALVSCDLADRRLATQIRRVDMGSATRVHLSTDNLDHTELGLVRRQEAAVGNQTLEALAAELVGVPKVNLDGHGLGNVLVDFFLNLGLPLAVNIAAELAAGALGKVGGLELVEALNLVHDEMAHGGAEDVAGRVPARVVEALLGVNGLLDGGAGLLEAGRGGGRGEAADVQDLAVVDYIHADGAHFEGRGRGGVAIGGGHGAYGAPVRRLTAALGVEDGLGCDDDVVFVAAVFEQLAIGLFERRERPGRDDGRL